MEFKDYQKTVLDTLGLYLDELTAAKRKADKIASANLGETDPDLIRPVPDWPLLAWTKMAEAGNLPPVRKGIPYSPRKDGVGEPVPNICFKIPTGGGKTLLGSAAVSSIFGRYLGRNTGFVLWIVPNEAIYTQTKKSLSNREHPYRQILDRAAAGRVKLLEKDDRLDARDLEANLCVMLLMLQSANRETQETLRMFKDRGNVAGFFPNEAEGDKHRELLERIPNLDAYASADDLWPVVKDSLGNVLRLIRPVVVMDEGHRAYSARAMKTLYGFNPCFVLELSATPKDRPDDTPPTYSNWLVDVRGTELDREGMVKLPLNVKVKAGDDWRDCLRESKEKLDILNAAADQHAADTGRYIRPILLVQVERVGDDQRDGLAIHAEDAKEYLLQLGFAEDEVAIKTSARNDLKAPENIDLLAPTCRVRAIITKQALQEGWDCPFAYVLCSLAVSSNIGAMTQLVGRILRQPYTEKTGIAALDECYVYCNHAQTREVVSAIKTGLEADGMADLALQIRETSDGNRGGGAGPRKVNRRANFDKLRVFLPKVLWVEHGSVRDLDYDQDILARLDWSVLPVEDLIRSMPENVNPAVSQVTRVSMGDGKDGEFFKADPTQDIDEAVRFDTVYATRVISDLVPNPWVGHAFVASLLAGLRERGFSDEKLGRMSSTIIEELRKWLDRKRDEVAERLFLEDVAAGRIQFRLRTDGHNWEVPDWMETDLPPDADQLMRTSGNPIEKSLFSPVYKDEFNGDERAFAVHLDEVQALKWWHRNVAKAGQYHVQGWRRQKVYPDFLFALSRSGDKDHLVVFETKGDQLAGNLDSAYKQKLLRAVSGAFQHETVRRAGELAIEKEDGTTMTCDLVLMSDWKKRLSDEIGAVG